ncbi:MAG: hypothetical protein HPY79_05865 [Bacteroidales bacterium]|nr:hypothetical protein [Bacteroidales bacterium]
MEENSMVLNKEIKSNLLSISKWLKFFSILGLVVIGMMFISSIFLLITQKVLNPIFENYEYNSNYFMPNIFIFMSIFYLFLSIIYLFPIIYLLKASIKLEKGLKENQQETVSNGIYNLKLHFKYMGILTIVLISLYLLFILGIILLVSFQ